MAALLALLSAAAYGGGDFFGGLSARRMPPAAVVLRSNALGLAALLCIVPWLRAGDVAARDLWLGAGGGIAGGIGLLLLYRGLSRGTMSVIAPITAVLSAVVPVVAGLAGGERPSAVALVGVPLALVAIALLASDPDGPGPLQGVHTDELVTALGAGLMFGFFFVALDATGDHAGLWPVVAGRGASTAMFFVIALAWPAGRAGAGVARRGTTPLLLASCGLLDASANALFLVATQHGMLTLVAVLGALYPASTLLLARTVLGERLAGWQRVGVVIALTAVVLVSAG
jgi:drug/metabolite transporter (DMT)-like permease